MTWFDLPGLSKVQKDLNIDDDILFLDFGHGGSSSGCVFYDGTLEKDYVLKFGLAVKEILEPFFKKIYTSRTTDKTVSLSVRSKKMTEIAKESKMLHVYSFHCNAYNGVANGSEWLLSIWNEKEGSDYKFCKQFLNDYCKLFGFSNRGIVQRLHPDYEKTDYYHLHRETPANCKSKYLELFFGDNRENCKVGNTKKYFEQATFFVASYILKRYGIRIEKPVESNTIFLVQAGAFKDKNNAEKLVKQLKSKGFEAIIKTQNK